jgi:hypothetical protein
MARLNVANERAKSMASRGTCTLSFRSARSSADTDGKSRETLSVNLPASRSRSLSLSAGILKCPMVKEPSGESDADLADTIPIHGAGKDSPARSIEVP